MAAALVSVSMGVMKPLLSKLTKLLEEEYVKLKGVRKQIKFLRDELSAMSPTLEMLADAEQLDPQTRAWRDKLRELSYDLEDCIDAFMARVDNERDGGFIKRFFRKLKKLKPRHEIANQIEELKASVIEVRERRKRYDLAHLKNKSGNSSVDPRLQAIYEDIEKLVGIDGPKKRIIDLLTPEANGSSGKLKVVAIAGCGGLGKTTLAKQVYDDIKSQFECATFVSVSRTPDVRKILIHIADGVKCTGINSQVDDVLQIINKLREHLQDKRYILVIDDLWNTEHWGFIRLALPDNALVSRIITTTRSITVAKCCSSQVYEMEVLSSDDSKRLFFRIAFGSENSCYPHLEDVPDKILRKCGGLPLAIVTLSGILTNKFRKAEWDRVLNAIGSTLANKPDAKTMTSILSLSYFDIPHHLRTCLVYLCLYPEDNEIEKQCLINRWIAEGFIHDEEGQTKFEIGERYFNDLINRSMIQPVEVKYRQAKACRVHDIILDYIKCKAIEENFVTSVDVDVAELAYKSEYKVHRLCVSNHNKKDVTIWEDQDQIKKMSQVRSVTIFGHPVKISPLPSSSSLRVLDLGYCRGMEDYHLASMGNLFNLKYLRLSSSKIRKLPDNFGELQHLQTLDVRGTGIEELPPTITKLQQLAHLYVGRDTAFPEGTIGEIHALEELIKYGVQSYKQGRSIQEFNKLTKLRTLEICFDLEFPDGSEARSQVDNIHNYVGNLLSSCNLHNLYISEENNGMWYPLSLHSWHPTASCRIQKLCVELPIYGMPNWMGSLGNLGVLQLMIICVRPEDVEILGGMPCLRFLDLTTFGGTRGRIVFPGNNGFRILEYFSLDIQCCGTSLEFEARSMSKLEHVKLEFGVHKMECLNGASSLGIEHLSSLNKVEFLVHDKIYDPVEDNRGDTFQCISRAIINAAIQTLPNRPTASFKILRRSVAIGCQHFESELKALIYYGLPNEWLKLWHVETESNLGAGEPNYSWNAWNCLQLPPIASDSTAQTGHQGADDVQEELYQMIKSLKDQYFADLNDLYNRISIKIQYVDNHMPTQKAAEQSEKMKGFKLLLERILHFLQVNKSSIQPGFRAKIPAYERQIRRIVSPRKYRRTHRSL